MQEKENKDQQGKIKKKMKFYKLFCLSLQTLLYNTKTFGDSIGLKTLGLPNGYLFQSLPLDEVCISCSEHERYKEGHNL